jgi:ribonuclease Z
MTTTVTLTGTGVPFPSADRAGAGTLVRYGDIALQFDAGRGTTVRLAGLGVLPHAISALFLTHLHSDHVSDVADLAHARWVQDHVFGTGPLPVVVCAGRAESFLDRIFDPYEYDIAVRRAHVQEHPPEVDTRPFAHPDSPVTVWTSPDGTVSVDAVRVRHEPVEEAVGYRVRTPDGVVVVSGDTRVCAEIEELATGADILVHEACRSSALAELVRGTRFETIFSYHADTVELGAMADRAGVAQLLLTHLIPAPDDVEAEDTFTDDVRRGGYAGPVTVGRDLVSVQLGSVA